MKQVSLRTLLFALLAGLFLGLAGIACGTGETSKCSPACGTGEVCFAENGTDYSCKKSCTKDDDCTAPMVCHTDETPAHCGEKE
jgi:hypothetical protein